MKKDLYKIDNSIDKLINNKHTLFLDNNEYNQIKYRLNKKSYNIYLPYKDSEKVILYKDVLPSVTLFKIEAKNTLKHQNILGSIMALNINSGYLGDIIVDNDNYYFYVLSDLKEFIIQNLTSIGKEKVTLKELDLNELCNYERKYKEIELLVSSIRIDNVLSKLLNTSRDKVNGIIKNKGVILNYQILNKNSYYLSNNDVFSVKRYGKYKYIDIINTTKKDKLVIKLLKYI